MCIVPSCQLGPGEVPRTPAGYSLTVATLPRPTLEKVSPPRLTVEPVEVVAVLTTLPQNIRLRSLFVIVTGSSTV